MATEIKDAENAAHWDDVEEATELMNEGVFIEALVAHLAKYFLAIPLYA